MIVIKDSLPLLSNAVIGGFGQHPDPIKRKLSYGAVQLYIPKKSMSDTCVFDLTNELTEISNISSLQINYQLWPLFKLDHICQAGRPVIDQNGYMECMLSLPLYALSGFLSPELLQNELMLPYMAIDQQDQSKCIPIWYDDLAQSNDSYVDGNYSDYKQRVI